MWSTELVLEIVSALGKVYIHIYSHGIESLFLPHWLWIWSCDFLWPMDEEHMWGKEKFKTCLHGLNYTLTLLGFAIRQTGLRELPVQEEHGNVWSIRGPSSQPEATPSWPAAPNRVFLPAPYAQDQEKHVNCWKHCFWSILLHGIIVEIAK